MQSKAKGNEKYWSINQMKDKYYDRIKYMYIVTYLSCYMYYLHLSVIVKVRFLKQLLKLNI